MKLKTTQNGSHDLIDATDENLIHDAIAAHAQRDASVQLRAEFSVKGPTGFALTAILDELDRRADAIMREWTEGVG